MLDSDSLERNHQAKFSEPKQLARGSRPGSPCALFPYETPPHLTGVTCPAPVHMGL